jgi:cysteine desulfurase/selenocysteine lyase
MTLLTEAQIQTLRHDFPILEQKIHGQPLVYLDNAATTQKPRQVLDRMQQYYHNENANVHRGIHHLSTLATQAYEDARSTVAKFLNAHEVDEIVFVRGTTEAINLVAHSFGHQFLSPGDEVIITAMEHHANIVPWQLLRERMGITLKILPMNANGELLIEQLPELINVRTKLIGIVHLSNTLGTINPIRELITLAHQHDIPVLVDGAQAVSHLQVDVQNLDCDFYAFSGHKLFGPTGIGVLYGKRKWLEEMHPYQSGGNMIRSVSFAKTEFNDLPYKFEAGTPNMAGAIGLSAAISYLQTIGLENIQAYEQQLLNYAKEALLHLPDVRLIAAPTQHASILSLVHDHIHAHDIGTILDQAGIAIRSGHHCTMPIMEFYGIPATARVSFAFYNTFEEIDRLIAGLEYVQEVFR